MAHDCIVDLEINIYGCRLYCKIPSDELGRLNERREALIALFESRSSQDKNELQKHLVS